MVVIQNVKEKVLTINGVQVYCTPMASVSVRCDDVSHSYQFPTTSEVTA